MLKPYFVELTVTAVMMAEDPLQARLKAEKYSHDITSDNYLNANSVTEVKSLDHLKKLTPE